LRAEDGDGRAQPDSFRAASDRGQDDVARGVHELRAVVLADVERVDSDGLGENGLLDGVADHLVAAERLTGLIHGYRQERVEAEFALLGHAHSLPGEAGELLEYSNVSVSRGIPMRMRD
jgi:hypothetical protein